MALWLLTKRGVTRTPFTLFAALGSMTALLSMWMSNVATTAMMMPIALSILANCPGLNECPRVRCNMVLLIAFAASIGGLGTPVGTPPNIIAMGFLRDLGGARITFLDWMKLGVPLVIVLMAGGMVPVRQLLSRYSSLCRQSTGHHTDAKSMR